MIELVKSEYSDEWTPDNVTKRIYSYQGHITDLSNLPKKADQPDIAAGSSCLFYEGGLAIYSASDDEWYLIGE